LLAAAVQSFTTALSRQYQSEDAPKPALGEFQSLGVRRHRASRQTRATGKEKESDKVRQQFLQWRHKANPSEAAQWPLRSE
jgi:hypothetical protein